MNLFNLAFFVHMMGLISLFGGFVLMQNAGARLRRAGTWEEARTWLSLLRLVPNMFIGGAVLMFASGWWMTRVQWSFATPWVVVGMTVAVLLLPIGAIVTRRGLARMERAAGNREGGITQEELSSLFGTPAFWSWILALNGAALGVVWLMGSKPGWTGSLVVPSTLLVLGALAGRLVGRRKPRASESPRVASRPLAHGGPGT